MVTKAIMLQTVESKLAKYDDAEGYDVPADWKQYPLCWLAYGSGKKGCIREDSPYWDDEDTMRGIINLLYGYYAALRDKLCCESGVPTHEVSIFIEPSYENESAALVVYRDRVILKDIFKAWNFGFDKPSDFGERAVTDYERMKKAMKGV